MVLADIFWHISEVPAGGADRWSKSPYVKRCLIELNVVVVQRRTNDSSTAQSPYPCADSTATPRPGRLARRTRWNDLSVVRGGWIDCVGLLAGTHWWNPAAVLVAVVRLKKLPWWVAWGVVLQCLPHDKQTLTPPTMDAILIWLTAFHHQLWRLPLQRVVVRQPPVRKVPFAPVARAVVRKQPFSRRLQSRRGHF